jgi:transcriptional regulator with XRE-family HTH domain
VGDPSRIFSAKELGERILASRLEASAETGARVSQEQLGAWVGAALNKDQPITPATVSRWEAGLAMPSLETVLAIARMCGVDPGWLAYGSHSRAPSPRERLLHEVPNLDAQEALAYDLGHTALLEGYRLKEIDDQMRKRDDRWLRQWRARFAALEREGRALFRIKDAAERQSRYNAWSLRCDVVSAELDAHRESMTQEHLVVMREAGRLYDEIRGKLAALSLPPRSDG